MPGLLERLRLLAWMPKRAKLESMESTLRVASAPERVALVDELAVWCGQKHPTDAIELLCLHWAREDASEVRTQIIERLRSVGRLELENKLAELLAHPDAEARTAGVGIVGLLPATSLAERLVPMLSDAAVGDSSERALTAMVDWLIEGKQHARAISPGLVGSALLLAAEKFRDHRRAGVLVCLARLIEANFRFPQIDGRPDQLAPWMKDPEHTAVAAMRRMLRTSEGTGLGVASWVWLKSPALGAAALDHLTLADGTGISAALARPQLAQNPARRSVLIKLISQKTSIAPVLLPDCGSIDGLSPAERRGYAAWVSRFPAPAKLRDAAIGSLLTDADPGVRHAAVRAAMDLDGRAPSLLDLCFDSDPRVARSAALGVACRERRDLTADGARERVLSELRRSPHASLRALGAGDDPDHPDLRRRLVQNVATDRARVVSGFAAKILSAQPAGVAAITAARRLRLVADLQSVLSEAIHAEIALPYSAEPRHRIACSAASALGDLRDAVSGDVLAAAIRAASPRLRANATDAMHRRLRRNGDLGGITNTDIRAMCDDPEHRPRASAARVLLGGAVVPAARMASVRDTGERTLLAMLEDRRPMHRIAGLWLAERAASRVSPLPEIVDAVASLARVAKGDEKARARLAAERLIIEVRAGWASRAQPMAADAEEAVA